MGCAATKNADTRTNQQNQLFQQQLMLRVHDYEKESQEFLNDLHLEPKSLMPEELRYGYISTNMFFNLFHAGFCAPYISNPNYLLLVDFRTREEFDDCRIYTARHCEDVDVDWQNCTYNDLCEYSVIVFYDYDGTASANILSDMFKAFRHLQRLKLDVLCILGGIKSICSKFPHLIRVREVDQLPSVLIPWMPSLIRTEQLYLGRHEQAEEAAVTKELRLTHVLSIGREPENHFDNVIYNALDGEENLFETFKSANRLITFVIRQNGRILVHGIEGLNRSAAVVIAYLMQSTPCIFEEAFFYVQVLRPFIRLDDECLRSLMKFEVFLFGTQVTDVEDLWI